MNTQEPKAAPAKQSSNRRGVVIVVVLLVVVLLSLAAYQYADLMLAEAAVTENIHRSAQTRCFAESGIYYTAALLSNQQNFTSVLNGNPYNNSQAFQGIAVQGDNGIMGRFSIIAPPDPTTGATTTCTYGVMDECGKINLISWMTMDPTGQQLLNMLSAVPNMTPDIANNIVAWMGGSAAITAGGAQDDYYSSLVPPYRCKNNVPESLDELLLVKGVTRDLLYGADANRNGVQDTNEQAGTSSTTPPNNGFDRGWSAYLTIHSREQNSDQNGNPYIWLNNADLQQLYSAISVDVDDDLAKFIVMYQQYGPASSTGGTQSLASTILSIGGLKVTVSSGPTTVPGTLSSYQPQYTKKSKANLTSMFQLVNASVNIPGTDPQTGKAITTNYASPLNNVAGQRALLPALFTFATVFPNPEIPARININTAPQEILNSVQNLSVSLPGAASLADTDTQNILQMRQQATGAPGDIYATPTWLLTEANIKPTILAALEPYITTRTQVYRVQSVGYFENGKGPAVRLEAVVDTNAGRPRIIAWRNLSDLGKGWTDPNNPSGTNTNPNP
jgi:type II secretory pathway component PulK